MQWYVASLAMLIILVWIGVLIGAPIITMLPWRMQLGARVFLSAPLGWAVLMPVITVMGWVGHGFAGWHCLLVTGGLAIAGAWTGRRWLRKSGRDAVRLTVFCVVASFPVLGSLLLHGAFGSYNDTIDYICHAQWLQIHGSLEPAHTDGGHPAWGPVIFFQEAHLRIGTSLLLAWVQSVFGREWSYEVYPLVAALGVICGALGVGATVLAACPGRWLEAWLTALATAVTANGFVFGATNGFLAQTWGLAFAAAAFGLRGTELSTRAQRSGQAAWRTGVPLGVGVASSMLCYWDLLPLEGPALALTYLLPWPGRNRQAWQNVWRRVLVPTLTCMLLVNAEWLHAIPGLVANVSAVVGNPVAWQWWEFPVHALGIKSAVWEGGKWIGQDIGPYVLLSGYAGVAVWLVVMLASLRGRDARRWLYGSGNQPRWRRGPLIPFLTWIGLTVVLVIHFRYFVASPWRVNNDTGWPDGVGQSWSQFKLTIWASFAVIGCTAAFGTTWTMGRRGHWPRVWMLAVLLAWCGAGLGWSHTNARRLGRHLLQDVGVRRDPFAVCLAARRMVTALPPGERIYLDWPVASHRKFRELMEYFLYDRPLASRWEDTGYLDAYVTPEDAKRTQADCGDVLRYRPPNGIQAAAVMTLEKTGQ